MRQIVAIFLILSPLVSCSDYTNFKVFKVLPNDDNQFKLLMQWDGKAGVDILNYGGIQRSSQVMVSAAVQNNFEKFLTANSISYQLDVDDIDEVLRDEKIERNRLRARRSAFLNGFPNFQVFWTLDEIETSMHRLANLYPKFFTLDKIGETIERRNIYAARISTSQNFGDKPIIFVDAGTHAREWAGHASAVFLMHQLVENSTISEELTQDVDWVIVPVVNPDGYVYTWEEDRLWRKNRRYVNYTCNGIDLNRNYPYLWRYSPESCPTNNYPGESGTSEPEIAAMVKYMTTFKKNLRLYLATHCAGNYILWPFGFKFDGYVKNYKEHQRLGERVAEKVRNATGTEYLTGNSADILYTANGCSDDFALAHVNANFAYTLELTPGGSGRLWHNFPQDRIFDLVRETFIMYREFGLFIKERFD